MSKKQQKDRRRKKKEKVEAVAEQTVVAATEPEAATGSTPDAPTLRLHPEIVEFLAELIVVDEGARMGGAI
jgi:hypothetical protein